MSIPAGFHSALTLSLNDHGCIFGCIEGLYGYYRGVLWTSAQASPVVLDTLGEGSWLDNDAIAISNGGVAVGTSRGPAWRATAWDNGSEPIDLGVLPGEGHDSSRVVDISDRGVAVGSSWASATLEGRACYWEQVDGQWIARPLPGSGGPQAVNNNGMVVGGEANWATDWPIAWLSLIADPIRLASGGDACGLNDNSIVVGATSDLLPIWWDASRVAHSLPLPSGCTHGCATAINGAGDITGWAIGCDAALWHEGVAYPLGNLIPAGSGWRLYRPTGINASGQIAGCGYFSDGDTEPDPFLLTPDHAPPTAPTSVVILPASPVTGDDLVASASGSVDPDGESPTYEYEWSRSTDAGTTWSTWVHAGGALANSETVKGDLWRTRARASDGNFYSAWVESAPVAVGNTAPATPTVSIEPASPKTDDTLVAEANATDEDGETPTYEVRWSRSADSGATWGAWSNTGPALAASLTAKGEQWKAQARAYDGMDYSSWAESKPVTIGNTAPAAPAVSISPASPKTDDALIAEASAADPDGDTPTYEAQWSRSTDDGTTWGGWSNTGSTLAARLTTKGEKWRARVRAYDGTEYGSWVRSASVTVANTAPTIPAVSVSPASPKTDDVLTAEASASDADGEALTYAIQWSRSADGGSTWSAWDDTGATLAASLTTKGELWKARARASDGTDYTPWAESAPVTIANTPPSRPAAVAVTPANPTPGDALTAAATGSTDPDPDSVSYTYEWARSRTGGDTWSAWSWSGALLSGTLTHKGELWRVRARATDGTASSGTLVSAEVAIGNTPPTPPASVTIIPTNPRTDHNLTARCLGSSDADRDTVTYACEWSTMPPDASDWGGWGNGGAVLDKSLTTRGQQWRARARAFDGVHYSSWAESAPVTIGNSPPTAPATVAVTPTSPTPSEDLTATASGGTDPDADSVSYAYEWSRSRTGGSTWSAWSWSGPVLSATLTLKGELWRVRACATDGTACSSRLASAPVTIGNTAPTLTGTVTIFPANPRTDHSLTARARGGSDGDGDPLTYACEWSMMPPGAHDWGDWGNGGAVLDKSLTAKGQQWRARARAFDGTDYTPWVESAPVTIVNTPPTRPTAVAVTPASPTPGDDLTATATGSTDADAEGVSYGYEWSRSRTGGSTWSAWSWRGSVLSATLTLGGELWRVRARAADGTALSARLESAPVAIVGFAERASRTLALGAATAPARGAGVVVTVSLSAPATVDVAVLNLAGRIVATLPARSLPAGRTSMVWNGVCRSGTLAPGGVYRLRVTARSAAGEQVRGLATFTASR